MKEIELAASISNIDDVTAFVDEQLEANDCSMKAQTQIDIAIDEIFSNVAFYGYPEGEGKVKVSVDFSQDQAKVIISFEDNGLPFNPLEKEDPDITLSAEERGIGGLGIFMVKKTMDSVHYEYKDNKNILTIEKTI